MKRPRRLPPGVRTLLWAMVGVVALTFAVQGGEYSTLDLLRQRRQTMELRVAIDSLQHLVDSLSRYRDRVLHDPKLQERIGREEFGWVRGDKELLYRFDTPDSARR
ncbi:MAG: FtsB family cell division protein [Gemmatimonadaceae bacterium]